MALGEEEGAGVTELRAEEVGETVRDAEAQGEGENDLAAVVATGVCVPVAAALPVSVREVEAQPLGVEDKEGAAVVATADGDTVRVREVLAERVAEAETDGVAEPAGEGEGVPVPEAEGASVAEPQGEGEGDTAAVVATGVTDSVAAVEAVAECDVEAQLLGEKECEVDTVSDCVAVLVAVGEATAVVAAADGDTVNVAVGEGLAEDATGDCDAVSDTEPHEELVKEGDCMGDRELEAECESEVEPKPLVEGEEEMEPERVPVSVVDCELLIDGEAEAEADSSGEAVAPALPVSVREVEAQPLSEGDKEGAAVVATADGDTVRVREVLAERVVEAETDGVAEPAGEGEGVPVPEAEGASVAEPQGEGEVDTAAVVATGVTDSVAAVEAVAECDVEAQLLGERDTVNVAVGEGLAEDATGDCDPVTDTEPHDELVNECDCMGDCELEAECESEVEPKPLVEGKGEMEPERVPVPLPLGEGDKEGTAEAEGDPELLGDCATTMLAASIKTRRRMAAGGQWFGSGLGSRWWAGRPPAGGAAELGQARCGCVRLCACAPLHCTAGRAEQYAPPPPPPLAPLPPRGAPAIQRHCPCH